jgi:ABC-2 type transport system permease protein
VTMVGTIARRDVIALVVSPAGWALAALFVVLTSAFGFVVPVLAGQAATLDGVFGLITRFLIPIVIPVITMRVFADEQRPIRRWEVTAGKWLGAFTFYVLLLATTLVYLAVLGVYVPGHLGALDLGLIGAMYVGLLLVGAAATAIGVLASCLVRTQLKAFFLALAVLLVTWYAGSLLGLLIQPPARGLFLYAGGFNRFQSFSLGQVALKDAAYFLSVAAGALFLAVRLVESRRSR